jgi:hypothetical protein
MSMSLYLFLDFDGVLHPFYPLSDRPGRESLRFSYLPRLEAVLRDHPLVQIVIASDWRKLHTLEELRAFFSPDIAARVIGVTPLDPSSEYVTCRRQIRVEEYLEQNGLQGSSWIALDDEWDNYQVDAPLIRCDDGFRDEEEQSLRAALKGEPIPGLRALAAAVRLSGDRDRAETWYRTHGIPEFKGLTAEQLVRAGREDDVICYIESLEAGAAG